MRWRLLRTVLVLVLLSAGVLAIDVSSIVIDVRSIVQTYTVILL